MIHNIQSLRFFAALLVVLHHIQPHVVAAGHAAPQLFTPFGHFGYFGVDIFFIISGFIMWYTTHQISGAAWGVDFALRRMIRIYSGYWPYFLLALLMTTLLLPASLANKDLLGSFLLARTPITQLLIPVSWTLSFELYFYALFALLILLPVQLRLAGVCVLALLVLGVQGYLQLVHGGYHKATFNSAPLLYRFYASPYLLEFFSGALLATLYQRLRPSPRLLLGLALLLLGIGVGYQSTLVEGTLTPGYYVVPRVALFGSSAFCLVWGCIALEQRGTTLLPRAGLFLGAISYSLYLSHTLLLDLLAMLGIRDWIGATGGVPLWYLLATIAIVGYSALHYHWVETPLRRAFRWLHHRLLRPPSAPAATT